VLEFKGRSKAITEAINLSEHFHLRLEDIIDKEIDLICNKQESFLAVTSTLCYLALNYLYRLAESPNTYGITKENYTVFLNKFLNKMIMEQLYDINNNKKIRT